MIERYYVTPKNMYAFGGNNKVSYTPVVVVKTNDHTHIYVSGRTSRDQNGELVGKGDMRVQIGKVCENIKISLESVGATFADVTRTATYTTDIPAYFAAIDERFKYFTDPLPANTLIGVARLALPDMLVEIEVEAIIEPERLKLT